MTYTDEQIVEALALISKAKDEVSELCGGKRWTMSIPARPQDDSDLVIADALAKSRDALRAAQERIKEPEAKTVPMEMLMDMLMVEQGLGETSRTFCTRIANRHGYTVTEGEKKS